jgi:hypothetical protein
LDNRTFLEGARHDKICTKHERRVLDFCAYLVKEYPNKPPSWYVQAASKLSGIEVEYIIEVIQKRERKYIEQQEDKGESEKRHSSKTNATY